MGMPAGLCTRLLCARLYVEYIDWLHGLPWLHGLHWLYEVH